MPDSAGSALEFPTGGAKNIPGLYQKHLNKQLVNRSYTYESGSGQQLKKRLSRQGQG